MAEQASTGVPYDGIVWSDIDGQPFGAGVGYNGLIFGDMRTLVDSEGALAIRGNVTSARGISVGYGRPGGETDIPYSPDAARFIAGGDVNIGGALTVVGQAVAGGSFSVGRGSSYIIGKDGSVGQKALLEELYYSANGSPNWTVNENADSFVISSYDTPRWIPAERVGADLDAFFASGLASTRAYSARLASLQANGSVTATPQSYILTGTNARQNVFELDLTATTVLSRDILIDVPVSSLAIVNLRCPAALAITSLSFGSQARATHTLFNFVGAASINLTAPIVIYGGVLSPDSTWAINTSGGSINGNAALGGLDVTANSGFELHWFPFIGGVTLGCGDMEYCQYTMCLPVTLTPYARAGQPARYCCGGVEVTQNGTCPGVRQRSCTFVISREICCAIPINCGARISSGAVRIGGDNVEVNV